METNKPLQSILFKLELAKHYVLYQQVHTLKRKKVHCGLGLLMRWDCVKWFIEEQIGLHRNPKSQNGIVVAKYEQPANDEEKDRWFFDNDMITPQRVLIVKVVPYWVQWDYKPSAYRNYPQRGPVEYPGPIQVLFSTAGLDLSSS